MSGTAIDGVALGETFKRNDGSVWRIFSFRLDDFGRYVATLTCRTSKRGPPLRRRILARNVRKWAQS